MENYYETFVINSNVKDVYTVDENCIEYLLTNTELEPQLHITFIPLFTTGDGNCLIHALSLCMWGKEQHSQSIRANLVSELNENQDYYKKYITENHDSEWTKIMTEAQMDGSTLTLFHMYALSNVLKRPIILVSSEEAKERFGEGETAATATFLPTRQPPDGCIKRPLVISWSSKIHNHFVALIPIDDNYINMTLPRIAYEDSLKGNTVDEYLEFSEPIIPTYHFIESIDEIEVKLQLINRKKRGVYVHGPIKLIHLEESLEQLLAVHHLHFNELKIDALAKEIMPWSKKYLQFDTGILSTIYKQVYLNTSAIVDNKIFEHIDDFLKGTASFSDKEPFVVLLLRDVIASKNIDKSFPVIDMLRFLILEHDIENLDSVLLLISIAIHSLNHKVIIASLRFIQNAIVRTKQLTDQASEVVLSVMSYLLGKLRPKANHIMKYINFIMHNIIMCNSSTQKLNQIISIYAQYILNSDIFDSLDLATAKDLLDTTSHLYDSLDVLIENNEFRRRLFIIYHRATEKSIKYSALVLLSVFYKKEKKIATRQQVMTELALLGLIPKMSELEF